MYHYAIQICYDGSAYNGWQRLAHTPDTLQGILEHTLSALLAAPIVLRGSGRTDAGVHACAQVADFFCPARLDCAGFPDAANALLPPDIRIRSVSPASPDFHSRKSCLQKTYAYCVSLDAKPDVFSCRYTYHPARPPLTLAPADRYLKRLRLDALQTAAGLLTGTHDFSAFTTDRQKRRSHIRTLFDIDVQILQKQQANILVLKFTGDGFLYNMVRILSGTLLEIGFGRRNANEIPDVLQRRSRRLAGPTLPANALFLCRAVYPDNAVNFIRNPADSP